MSEVWWQELEKQCRDVLTREGTPDSDRVHSGHQAGTAPSDARLELLHGLQAHSDLQIVWRLHKLIPEILIAIFESAGKDVILNLQGALTKLLKDYQRLFPEQKGKLPDPRVPERLSGLPTVIAALNAAEVAVERKVFAPTSFADLDRWLKRPGLVTETAKLPLLDLSRLQHVSLVNRSTWSHNLTGVSSSSWPARSRRIAALHMAGPDHTAVRKAVESQRAHRTFLWYRELERAP
jgi:hypothetical protein